MKGQCIGLPCGGGPFRTFLGSGAPAVADLADKDFERPSGCAGQLVRDLVHHLVIDAQDVLITPGDPRPHGRRDDVLARHARTPDRPGPGGRPDRPPGLRLTRTRPTSTASVRVRGAQRTAPPDGEN
ncbi:maleylpyruvate isomerase N-terminal domain-containing protein [Streptomyces bottropensis]|uniref:maleylpyruvate isomerase N-terminal domain-containing protein n=1 Tax=Streptomyces bottropensis TaxID=42235 RepID=UPI003A8FC18C